VCVCDVYCVLCVWCVLCFVCVVCTVFCVWCVLCSVCVVCTVRMFRVQCVCYNCSCSNIVTCVWLEIGNTNDKTEFNDGNKYNILHNCSVHFLLLFTFWHAT
jgi:hypothetical protein